MFKSRGRVFAWVVMVCLLVWVAPSLMAQTASTGAVKGTVTDSSGAVIPNVTVTATNAGTGQSRSATTGSDGSYSIPLLPLGTYTVKFEASGFNTEQVPSIVVNVSETTVLNRALAVGSQTQAVTVQAEAEEVQTSNATLGTVVGASAAAGLPLTTRNYTNLLGLSAGANASVFNASTLGKGTTDIAVNGNTTKQNNVSMDGVSIQQHDAQGVLAGNGQNPDVGLVNPDAIQEFKIQTSMFDATFGRNPGANVNVVTKSGTNEFHGSVFEFFRNTDLNANDYFRNQSLPVNGVATNSRFVLNQNQFGGVIGGPIKKDKLFFFSSYQETRQINGESPDGYSATNLMPIPGTNGVIGSDRGTAATQALFAAQLGAEFCPGGPDGGNVQFGGTGVTQVLCSGANINPIALNLLQLKNPDGSYYIPSASAQIAGGGVATKFLPTTFSIPARFTEHQFLQNVDYVINSKNTLSAHYFYGYDPTQDPFQCGSGASVPGNCYPNTALINTVTNTYAVLKLTSIVTNNLVNEARVSLQRNTFVGVPSGGFTNAAVGLPNLVPGTNFLDGVTVTGAWTAGTSLGGGSDSQKWLTDWEAADLVSWTHGKHTVRFGAEVERDRYNWLYPGLAVGSLNFDTVQDFLLGLPGCVTPGSAACTASTAAGITNGSAYSNVFSSGTTANFNAVGGILHYFRIPFGDAYVQDDIKLKPQFTLNLGLRWEYDGIGYDKLGNAVDLWPSLVNTVPIPGNSPSCPAGSPATCTPGTLAGFVLPSNYNFSAWPAPPAGVGGLYQNNEKSFTQNPTGLHNFAPRVGFAWSPEASNRLVLRGGAGYFYDRVGTSSYLGGVTQSQPYSLSVFQSGTANYFSSEQQPYPQNLALGWYPRWVNFGTGANNSGATTSNLVENSNAPVYLTPVVYEWNLFTQYEFISHWTFEIGYVGSRGIHQNGGPALNEPGLVGNVAGTNNGWTQYPGIASGLVTENLVSNAALRVPYLGFSPAGITDEANVTDTKFASLQATVRHQFAHGFQAQIAYSFSRGYSTDYAHNDPNTPQYGPNTAYHPQRVAINYLWNIPANYQGLLGKFTNGWGVSGVTIVQDGTPLTITDVKGGSIYGSINPSTAMYCAGGGPASAGSPGSLGSRLGGLEVGQGYFNKADFLDTVGTGSVSTATCGTAFPVLGNGTGYGNVPYGILLGPGQFNWDMSLTKTTKVGGIHEDATLQFRTEFFNMFNHPQFNNPTSTSVTSGSFGLINSTSVNPRLIQFALKYLF